MFMVVCVILSTYFITLRLCNKIPYALSRNVYAGSLKSDNKLLF